MAKSGAFSFEYISSQIPCESGLGYLRGGRSRRVAYLSPCKDNRRESVRVRVCVYFQHAASCCRRANETSFITHCYTKNCFDIIVAEWTSLSRRPVYERNKNNNTPHVHVRVADAEEEIKRFGDAASARRCEQEPLPPRRVNWVSLSASRRGKTHRLARLSPQRRVKLRCFSGLSGVKIERP